MKTNLNKIVNTILYFLNKNWWEADYIKILKLIFLADKFHLKKYWYTISTDNYLALKQWPVWVNSLNIIKWENNFFDNKFLIFDIKDGFFISSNKEIDLEYFSETEINSLDFIYNEFWNLTYWNLIEETKKYVEWKKFKDYIETDTICIMNFADFFENSLWQNKIFDLSKEYIESSKNLYKTFQNFKA